MLGLGRLYDNIPLMIPIDFSSSQGGDQFSLRDAGGVDLWFFFGDASAGDDLKFTVKRHTDMSDATGTTIDLSAISHPYYYYKQHGTTAVGVGTWAKGSISDTDGAAVVLDDANGEASAMLCFHIDKRDLGDGYTALSVSAIVTGDASGAKIGAAWATLTDPAVQRTPANLRSALE
ncbi:MAG: hypothetical protein AB7P33_09805 [Dehalococcoidia bacterium]